VAEKSANVAEAPALRSQEGIIARRDFPLSIDRRRLLTSAAAITMTGVVPDVNPANSAAARDFVQPSQMTLDAGPANVSAATARRLVEIARRNVIRREANLPLLSIPQELRRMKKQEEEGDLREIQSGSCQGGLG